MSKLKSVDDCRTGNDFINFLAPGRDPDMSGKNVSFRGTKGQIRIENSSVPMSKPERKFLVKLLRCAGVIAVIVLFIVANIGHLAG